MNNADTKRSHQIPVFSLLRWGQGQRPVGTAQFIRHRRRSWSIGRCHTSHRGYPVCVKLSRETTHGLIPIRTGRNGGADAKDATPVQFAQPTVSEPVATGRRRRGRRNSSVGDTLRIGLLSVKYHGLESARGRTFAREAPSCESAIPERVGGALGRRRSGECARRGTRLRNVRRMQSGVAADVRSATRGVHGVNILPSVEVRYEPSRETVRSSQIAFEPTPTQGSHDHGLDRGSAGLHPM